MCLEKLNSFNTYLNIQSITRTVTHKHLCSDTTLTELLSSMFNGFKAPMANHF